MTAPATAFVSATVAPRGNHIEAGGRAVGAPAIPPCGLRSIIRRITLPVLAVLQTGEMDGKNFWDRCGVVVINRNPRGEITSIQVRHNMFPGHDMVAFPRREDDEQ